MIGRTREQEMLQHACESAYSEFVAVYGRRRGGTCRDGRVKCAAGVGGDGDRIGGDDPLIPRLKFISHNHQRIW